MKKALFAGTFDPPSLGHLDIITRACSLCDKLLVGIGNNSSKKDQELFSLEEKLEMLKKITSHLPNVEIHSFAGLVVDFAKKNQVNFLLRALRSFSDWEMESSMAQANRKIGEIETLFLIADERFSHISSTVIRELGCNKKRLHDFVPAVIEEFVFATLSKDRK
jgi:pantetheine-phosphate adenylyltransferase